MVEFGDYAMPGFRPTAPNSDWYIDGQRYAVVSRTTNDKGQTVTVRRPAEEP